MREQLQASADASAQGMQPYCPLEMKRRTFGHNTIGKVLFISRCFVLICSDFSFKDRCYLHVFLFFLNFDQARTYEFFQVLLTLKL